MNAELKAALQRGIDEDGRKPLESIQARRAQARADCDLLIAGGELHHAYWRACSFAWMRIWSILGAVGDPECPPVLRTAIIYLLDYDFEMGVRREDITIVDAMEQQAARLRETADSSDVAFGKSCRTVLYDRVLEELDLPKPELGWPSRPYDHAETVNELIDELLREAC